MIYLGRIIRAHGTRGRMFVGEVSRRVNGIAAGTRVHIGYSANFSTPYTIQNAKRTPGGLLMGLEEIRTPEDVAPLREQGIFVAEEALRNATDRKVFAESELLGCEVYEQESGALLGTIVDVWELPANDVWLMSYQDKELPLPVIDDVIKKVDIAARRVEIYLLPGLTDLAD